MLLTPESAHNICVGRSQGLETASSRQLAVEATAHQHSVAQLKPSRCMHLPASASAGVLRDLRSAASSWSASCCLTRVSFANPKNGRVLFHSSLEIGGADAVLFNALGSALVLALRPSRTRFLISSRLSDVGCDVVLWRHKVLFYRMQYIGKMSAI